MATVQADGLQYKTKTYHYDLINTQLKNVMMVFIKTLPELIKFKNKIDNLNQIVFVQNCFHIPVVGQ